MNDPIELLLTGEVKPEQTFSYIHLPVEVPEGIGRIEVEYDYDAAIASDPLLMGGNTLDIGLFDPRGVEFPGSGYRGWTGSASRSLFISTDDATPGYMPGPIQAGTWHICLGVYKVAPEGCHYTVRIRMNPQSGSPRRPTFPARLQLSDSQAAAPQQDGWYKGDLHCHTVHSDGDSTVEEVVRLAEARGLDFLAITDHNNLTQQVDLKRVQTHLALIPGLEVTTYHGHWNVWGDGAWIDFRINNETDLQRALDSARQQGYLVSVNHPRPHGPDWAFRSVQGYDGVEVWNGPWKLMNEHCLAFWVERLNRGERLTVLGGSDHHISRHEHTARLGTPTTFIYATQPPRASDLLASLRAGHAFISESPAGPHLSLNIGEAMMGDSVARPTNDTIDLTVHIAGGEDCRLEVYTARGLVLHMLLKASRVRMELMIPVRHTSYVRAQLVDPASQQVRALTNPIYIDDPI